MVLGLDPDPAKLWPAAVESLKIAGAAISPANPADPGYAPGSGPPEQSFSSAGVRAAHAVAAHCRLVIEAAGEHCVAVKLQLACFERLGAPGWEALASVISCAREHELLVLADGKRGDIDVSAAAYAQAFFGHTDTPFGPVAGLGADALTVNPLMGRDSLDPFLSAARASGAGVFVLVRTSNPGAEDVQELTLTADGTVSETLAGLVRELGAAGIGDSGLSDVGAVVGATAPARLAALRELMPQTIFLLPGVGAQGGTVDSLKDAFAPGPAAGLITVSRGIVAAHERDGGDPAQAAAAQAQRLREAAWSLTS